MPNAFQRRVLAERTRVLAGRGLVGDAGLLPPHLVCVCGSELVALPMALVTSIRPFGCQPVPLLRSRAAPIVLGVALFGYRLASVLDLARLLSPAHAAVATGAANAGSMLLLRATEMPVAVRVEQVLGVMRLLPSTEPGRALMPRPDASDGLPDLVTLLAADRLAACIALLDAS